MRTAIYGCDLLIYVLATNPDKIRMIIAFMAVQTTTTDKMVLKNSVPGFDKVCLACVADYGF